MLRHSYLSDTHVGLLKQSAIENDGFSFGFFYLLLNWSLKSESLFQALTAWKNSFLMVAFHVSVYFPKMPKKKI